MRMLPTGVLIALLLCAALPLASPYGTGAPSSACSSLTPAHGGAAPSPDPAPFTLTPHAVSVEAGQQVRVTLEGVAGAAFKGFLLQARHALSDAPLGSFQAGEHAALGCGGGAQNAVTHVSPASKTSVSVEWTAPAGEGGEVVFVATVVQDFSRFWTALRSEKVTVAAPLTAPAAPAAPATAPETAPMEKEAASTALGPLEGCGETKGCFTMPAGCSSGCAAAVTYVKKGELFEFELTGQAGPGDSYVAVALSGDAKMGADSVMACRSRGGAVDLVAAYNDGKSSALADTEAAGLSSLSAAAEDGALTCRFTRAAQTTVEGVDYDLEEPWYLLLAHGPVAADGSLQYHAGRAASAEPASLASFASLGAASGDLLVTLHASFMVVAWLFAASSGMTIAHFFKQTWTAHKYLGVDMWFNIHRLMMVTTWLLTVAGFIIILVAVGGWTQVPVKENPHAVLGVVSVVLCFIQPFLAAMRCAPDHPKRPVFKWFHWFFGNTAQSLAFTAVFYGLQLVGLFNQLWWIMVVFLVVHVAIQLTLSVFECKQGSPVEDGVPMREMANSRDAIAPRDGKGDAPGGGRRKAVLAVYLTVAAACAGGLVAALAVGAERVKAAL